MTVTPKEKQAIAEQGYALLYGSPKQTYWTPDGRPIKALPDMRAYTDKNGGGTRDANLDRGWLLQKPTDLKPYCDHCGLWHDTQEGIDDCGEKIKAFTEMWDNKAKKELEPDERMDKLESEMGDIKELLVKLLERRK